MIGLTLSHYRIVARVAEGGMGEVYRAQDVRLGRTVAIKILRPEAVGDPERKRRFMLEAQAASALNHPNIVTIYETDSSDGVDFIVMEFVEGHPLAALIGPRGLPTGQALAFAVQLSDALAVAHAAGIVHRDIKPANVIVADGARVKVLDFGLAKLTSPETVDEDASTVSMGPRTAPGIVIGTVAYMSPEQAQGKRVDLRTDVFSFGCVLYEMLTGHRPFGGDSQPALLASILRDEPTPLRTRRADLPVELERIVARCLEKDPMRRYPSAGELAQELAALQSRLNARSQRFLATLRRPLVAIPAALCLVAAVGAAGALSVRRSRQSWALEVALPEIARLADEKRDLVAAYRLAMTAERAIPDNPTLLKQWSTISRYVAVYTEPPGAIVRIRPYPAPETAWIPVGTTPFDAERIPRGFFRWRIERPGFAPVEFASTGVELPRADPLGVITLDAERVVPPEMVRVRGGKTELDVPGLSHLASANLPDYWIDRYEVTNRSFKDFVDGGAYSRPTLWTRVVEEGAGGLRVGDVVDRFRDATGRPGPAEWKLGEFPPGEEAHPVSGISWFEASAYCESVGKQLPTIYHWYRAAGTDISSYMVPVSNFSGRGPIAVGSSGALGPFGTYDTAGNVREWVWNRGIGRRYALGGAWNEPTYVFKNPDGSPPFERLPSNGFRCMKATGEGVVPEVALAAIPPAPRELQGPSVPESEYRIYERLYSYDRTPLDAQVERAEKKESLRRERVTLRAAYGDERFALLIFLPEHPKARYPVVVYFPGSEALYAPSSEELWTVPLEFLVKSGRAVCLPVYKGTYERRTGMKDDDPDTSRGYRDHVIMWSKDLGRAIDYLETRPDLDTARLAYYGLSWGAALGAVLPAVEKRIKLAVLDAGGFFGSRALPEADQRTFAPRVKMPVLMVNGRYDYFFPVQASQRTLFQVLGTPVADKTHVLLESGHWELSTERIRVILDWLDRMQGSSQAQNAGP
jgi:formylglycine-generating enzyme required for sulfatase activity/tRNA A-37 threonylcarbamoyl transferase component Bud32/dienelactone hydrolase